MSQNKKIAIGFLIIILVADIIGYFILPDVLIMQVNFSGEASTTLNKWIGLLSLLVLGLVGFVYVFKNEDPAKKTRGYLILVVITFVHVMLFILNL